MRLTKRNSPRMAEVNIYENREGSGEQPGRAKGLVGPGVPGPRARRPRARPAGAQPSRVLRPAGTGWHRPRRVHVRRRDHDAAGQLRGNGKDHYLPHPPDTLLALYANAQVSFEVDRFDEAFHEGWSVLAQGHAHKVTDERAVKRLEDGTHLEPWAAGARDVYIRIAPTWISGRHVQPSWATPPVPGAEP